MLIEIVRVRRKIKSKTKKEENKGQSEKGGRNNNSYICIRI
jgi:hypothetical protein